MKFDKNAMYSVKNRCAGVCIYKVPELHVRRSLASGQTIQVSGDELEKLNYQPGGRVMLAQYLQIEKVVLDALDIRTEPEYDMSEKDIINLIQNGSIDQFMDTLDFAPNGVIDLIKTFAVTLPMNDANKRIALKDKTGFDVDSAIRHSAEEKEEDKEEAPKERRVKPTQSGRRAAPPDYNVVGK